MKEFEFVWSESMLALCFIFLMFLGFLDPLCDIDVDLSVIKNLNIDSFIS